MIVTCTMGSAQTASRAIVVQAPAPESEGHRDLKSVFLAGPTSGSRDWREDLIKKLADLPITIFNPLRPDWDSTWREELSFAPWREQVEWELTKQEKATVIALYFSAGTDAPISLLELGLCAKENKAIVYVEDGYRKKGNVLMVCEMYNIEAKTEIGAFGDGIRGLLGL